MDVNEKENSPPKLQTEGPLKEKDEQQQAMERPKAGAGSPGKMAAFKRKDSSLF